MIIRDILLHLDTSTETEARLDLAIQYAMKHQANLRGLCTINEFENTSKASTIESMFKNKTAEFGVSSEWICIDQSVTGADIMETIITQAYYSDLIIVGQANSRSLSRNLPIDLLERLVLASGRPVLVVPYAGTFKTAGVRIMIAWKTGRESVRSVNDALPFLKAARYVSIMNITSETISSENDGLMQIRDYLAHRKVTATADHVFPGNLTVGDTLLNLTCQQAIDLLVMGACAYTRGKLALSPVVRYVLNHHAVPVLISH